MVGMGTTAITVFACEPQPIVIEGLVRVLESAAGFQFAGAAASLADAVAPVGALQPQLILVSSGGDVLPAPDAVAELRRASPDSRLVLWVDSQEPEFAAVLDAGFSGVIHKARDVASLLQCLRTVGEGGFWAVGPVPPKPDGFGYVRTPHRLTPREREIAQLAANGLKNKEIAEALGISPGTVKVHLMHIFEKTGVENRFQLAASARRPVRTPVE